MTQKDEDIIRKCNRRMQDGVSSEEVSKRCDLGNILEKTRQGRLQWFGHVREREEGVLRMAEKMQMTRKRLPGRPKGTLEQLLQRNMKKKGLKEEQAMDRKVGKS